MGFAKTALVPGNLWSGKEKVWRVGDEEPLIPNGYLVTRSLKFQLFGDGLKLQLFGDGYQWDLEMVVDWISEESVY